MEPGRLARVVVGVVVLPHELAHALPARLAGLEAEVSVLPDRGQGVPLGRFDAAVDRSTPPALVRLCALAPLPTHLAVAAVLGAVVPAGSALVALFPLVTFWATLSAGDLAVAANPTAATEAGRFQVPTKRWHTPVSLLFVPPTALAVALLLVA